MPTKGHLRIALFTGSAPLVLVALFHLARAQEPTLTLAGATLVDAAGPRPGMTIVIRADRIDSVGPAGSVPAPPGSRVVDANGRFLIPGLWDMHVHVALRPEEEIATGRLLALHLAHGVVGVRDMGGDPDRLAAWRAGTPGRREPAPEVLFAGPFVDGPQDPSPAFLSVASEPEARRAVADLRARRVDFVKVQAKLGRREYLALAAEAVRLGVPFAGHVPESLSAREVVASGQRSIEHVSPALPGDAGLLLACSESEAELRRDLLELGRLEGLPDTPRDTVRERRRSLQRALVETYSAARCDELFREMARRRVHVVPTLVWGESFLPAASPAAATETALGHLPGAVRDRWTKGLAAYLAKATAEDLAVNRRIAERSRALVSELKRAGVPVLAGTDSLDAFVVPGQALHRELEALVAAGFSPLEALGAATAAPAAFRGRPEQEGRIAPGAAADLVLLDADPLADIRNVGRIHAVVRAGRLLDRADLDALLAGRSLDSPNDAR